MSKHSRVSDTDDRLNLLLHHSDIVESTFRSQLIAKLLLWVESTTEDQTRLKAMKEIINDICWSTLRLVQNETKDLFLDFFKHKGDPLPKGKCTEVEKQWSWADK